MSSPGSLPDIGDWFSRSFRLLPARVLPMTLTFLLGVLVTVLAMLMVFALGVLAVILIQGTGVIDSLRDNPERLKLLVEDPAFASGFVALWIAASLVGLRVWMIFLLAIHHLALGTVTSVGEGLRLGRARALGFLGLLLLVALFVQLAMLAFIIPGIIVAVFLLMSRWAFVGEGLRIMDSLRRSWALVAGRWWGVLGRTLLWGLVVGAITIVPVLGWIAGPCLALIGMAVLYQDLRDTAAA